MISCLILVSNDLPMLPSEAQEVINTLNKNKYRVQLLQTGINTMELYRTLQNKPFDLVWVAGHASDLGFMFKDVIISPTELALFLNQANCTDLVLNSCYSIDHVQIIQQITNTNILATIVKELNDTVAWRDALYLCQAIVNNKTLIDAYEQTLALTVSNYRYFPARLTVKKANNQMSVDEERIRRIEDSLLQIGRIVNGDPYLRVKGLLDVAGDINANINARNINSDNWRKEIELKIKLLENGLLEVKGLVKQETEDIHETIERNETRLNMLERNSPENYVVLSKGSVGLLLLIFVISAAIVIAIVLLLKP